jgi:hypothetical protein
MHPPKSPLATDEIYGTGRNAATAVITQMVSQTIA